MVSLNNNDNNIFATIKKYKVQRDRNIVNDKHLARVGQHRKFLMKNLMKKQKNTVKATLFIYNKKRLK